MPFPRALGRYAQRHVNKVTVHFAGHLAFADLEHVGRRSGQVYHTPVRAFRRRDKVVIGINFGRESDWLKNIQAAGNCRMRLGSERLDLGAPRIVPLEEGAESLPRPVAAVLRYVVRTTECVELPVLSHTPAGTKLRYRLRVWMYRGGRPNRLARAMNRISAVHFASGRFAPRNWATLEVPGRRTGRIIAFPVVVTDHQGERYVVAMLGENVNWVRNVRAAGGRAVLRHGTRQDVRLEEVAPGDRAPILRRYLELAPGARPHIPVERGAPLAEFGRIAPRIPVFRLVPAKSE